jgi:hypothetical protein
MWYGGVLSVVRDMQMPITIDYFHFDFDFVGWSSPNPLQRGLLSLITGQKYLTGGTLRTRMLLIFNDFYC